MVDTVDTGAPERIWAWNQPVITRWSTIKTDGSTEYIRKDISDARIAELEAAISVITIRSGGRG